jgi:hypothetical protein
MQPQDPRRWTGLLPSLSLGRLTRWSSAPLSVLSSVSARSPDRGEEKAAAGELRLIPRRAWSVRWVEASLKRTSGCDLCKGRLALNNYDRDTQLIGSARESLCFCPDTFSSAPLRPSPS